MNIALWLLVTAGPIGAIDVLYFHFWKFKLYRRPQSRKEEVTHILRGIVAPGFFGILLIGRPEGTFFSIVMALFLIDMINSLIDVVVEPASRAPIGVPPMELALHFISISLLGAAFGIFMYSGWPTRMAPSALVAWPHGMFPWWFAPSAWSGLAMGGVMVVVEACLLWKYRTAS